MTAPNEHTATDGLADLRRVTATLAEVCEVADLAGALETDVRPIFEAIAAIVVRGDGDRVDAVSGEHELPDDDASFAAARAAARSGETAWLLSASEIAARHPALRSVLGAIVATPLRAAGGNVGALVLGFREAKQLAASERALIEDVARQVAVTVDRVRLLEETERQRDRIEEATRERTEFIARLGHELRNPLAALRTAAELLRLGTADEKLKRIQAVVERQTEQLVALVDELLETTRRPATGGSGPPRAKIVAPSAPVRVLLVEDNEDTASLLQALLESLGYESTVAADGENAIDVAHRFAPDVVLCDVGLPGVSGYDVARAFRGNGQLRDVFLVVLTGYGRPEDVEEARAAGFDAHKTKPIDTVAIQDLVHAMRTSRTSDRGARGIQFLRR
jgi:CheY-like chemotaxis protein